MTQEHKRITELTYKFASGDISSSELDELMGFIEQTPGGMERLTRRISPDAVNEKIKLVREWEAKKENSRENVLRLIAAEKAPSLSGWMRVSIAASILLAVSGMVFYLISRKVAPSTSRLLAASTDIQPGGNKATLLLSNGSLISLDASAKGTIAMESNATIVKTAPAELSYKPAPPAPGNRQLFNKITTPRGGQYQVVLPDGTKAWLNAASSLTFPTFFSGNKREVEVTGEVAFEVAKNPDKPFVVTSGSQSITVLGTQFDVVNYAGEPQITTLLTGAIRVLTFNHSALLRPGQSATIMADNPVAISTADTTAVMAWRNGEFRFREATIDEVMRQLSRWYDIQVIFVGQKPRQTITAAVSRKLPASVVLRVLTASGYHFNIDKDRIEVMP